MSVVYFLKLGLIRHVYIVGVNEAFKTGNNVLKEANIMEISLNTFAQRNLPDDSPLHSYHRHTDPRMLCIFFAYFPFSSLLCISYFIHLLFFLFYPK